METNHYTLLLLLSLLGFCVGCSKTTSDTPTPAPEEDVVTPVAGIYTLTKATAAGGSPMIAGVGSLTISVLDKTTAAITQIRSFTNASTGATSSISSKKNETSKIEKSGSTYLIKATNGLQWATISGNRITTDDYLSLTPTTSLTVNTEYTK